VATDCLTATVSHVFTPTKFSIPLRPGPG
jgi:hypothetical protein